MHAIPQSPAGVLELGHEGVSTALEHQVGRFTWLIHKIAWEHRLSGPDVDELVQDVRIRLWRSLSTGERIASAPASYVRRTAISAAVDLIRRRTSRPEDPTPTFARNGDASRDGDPDRELGDIELMDLIEDALGSLPVTRRPVVRMHLVGYHRNEIADLMGWTESKTRNLLYRGLSDLRHELASRGVTPEAVA